jgi:mannose-6-phosphate isomerase-like protein (cupin superfamily)
MSYGRRCEVAATEPLFAGSGDGERIAVGDLGIAMRVLVPAAASGGDFCLVEETTAPGGGPPLHVHPRQTELFLVLEGEYEFAVGERRFRAGPGEVALVPPGTPHTFRNAGAAPGRFVFMLTPALGGEAYFRGLAELAGRGVRDPEELNRFGAPLGTEFVGPPLSA